MRIGAIDISPAVALAPMEGVTDRAFRGLVRSLGGCGLTVTEFVSSEALTRDVQDAWSMAELDPDEHPVSIQIYGRDPERMAEAARLSQGLGADMVDINLGCPSKRVTSGASGSALMKEPERAFEIFEAVAQAVTCPFTVKMRLGWSLDTINAPEIAAGAVERGASMITVHARSRMCAYKGHARWELVRPVRDAIGAVPLLINGDIVDPDSARRARDASGADGVMIGRAAISNPWVIRSIADALQGVPSVEPGLEERRLLMLDYLDRLRRLPGSERRAGAKFRRVLGGLSHGVPGASRLRAGLSGARSFAQVQAMIESWYAELGGAA